MMSSCESVTERVALGEPVGELAEHVAGCANCQRVVELTGQLGSAHREVDPGLGFSARMTVGAQRRLGARRRRRVAVGLAATVAASMLAVFALTRSPELPSAGERVVGTDPSQQPTQEPAPVAASDDDLKALLELANVDHNSHVSARWRRIEKPLAPYRKVLAGVVP